MKSYVYKITREDDKEYVGITIRLNKRIRDHERSERFSQGIKKWEILAECETYKEAETLEEEYIKIFDTFENGLNESIDGKGNHLSPSFTTFGFKYSELSKEKMRKNHWSKRGFRSSMLGKSHSDETKMKFSEKRKGFCFGKRKITLEESKHIIEQFSSDNIQFDKEFISRFIKKSQIEPFLNNELEISELVSPNGKPLTKETLYSEWFCQQFGTTNSAIRRIITGKVKLAKDYNG